MNELVRLAISFQLPADQRIYRDDCPMYYKRQGPTAPSWLDPVNTFHTSAISCVSRFNDTA